MTVDISSTLAPNSEQLDAVELVGGPQTFIIESVSKGPADQPVQIHLKDFPRPWRPGKSMRRVLVAAWGPDASLYVGRRVTLFCDPNVRFGSDRVGGTRISHMSHLSKPLAVPLLVTRGKSAMYTVEPLIEAPKPAPVDVSGTTDVDTLRSMWRTSNAETRAQIEARIAELNDGALIPSGGAA